MPYFGVSFIQIRHRLRLSDHSLRIHERMRGTIRTSFFAFEMKMCDKHVRVGIANGADVRFSLILILLKNLSLAPILATPATLKRAIRV